MNLTCPNCKAASGQGTKYCQSCGSSLEPEYIDSPICPTCKVSYAGGTVYCINDGSKLVRPEDLIPRCVKCNTAYSHAHRYCPKDGGEVKVMVSNTTAGTQNTHHTAYAQPAYDTPPAQAAVTANYSLHLGSLQVAYPKASLSNRFLAALIDHLIALLLGLPAIAFIVMSIRQTIGFYWRTGALFFLLAGLLCFLPLMYILLKDGIGDGQSVGKSTMNLMVVDLETKTPCTKSKSLVRNLVSMLLNAIPYIGWLIEPLVLLITPDGKKVGDMAARTQVIDTVDY